MATKMHRWICPNCESGVNAPSKPRGDDTRRFCLPCSQETGRLVKRTAPALDAKREKKTAARTEKARRERAAISAKRAAEREHERAIKEADRKATIERMQRGREAKRARDLFHEHWMQMRKTDSGKQAAFTGAVAVLNPTTRAEVDRLAAAAKCELDMIGLMGQLGSAFGFRQDDVQTTFENAARLIEHDATRSQTSTTAAQMMTIADWMRLNVPTAARTWATAIRILGMTENEMGTLIALKKSAPSMAIGIAIDTAKAHERAINSRKKVTQEEK